MAEIGAAVLVERSAAKVPRVGQPLHRGMTGILWRTATVLSAASLALSLIPGKSRKPRMAAGILGVAGSLCLRFAVHYIGDASARDPRSAFQQQRAG